MADLVEKMLLGFAEEDWIDVGGVGQHSGHGAAADFKAVGAGVGAVVADADAGGALAEETSAGGKARGGGVDAFGVADDDGIAWLVLVLNNDGTAGEHVGDALGGEIVESARGEFFQAKIHGGLGGGEDAAGGHVDAHAGEAGGEAIGAFGGVGGTGDGFSLAGEAAEQVNAALEGLVRFVEGAVEVEEDGGIGGEIEHGGSLREVSVDGTEIETRGERKCKFGGTGSVFVLPLSPRLSSLRVEFTIPATVLELGMMSNGAICPDCGGVIGGDPKGARPACQCSMSLTMDDTAVEAQPAPPAAEASVGGASTAVKAVPPPGAKICCICGKDVTNAKRAKDARGYWCYECHRKDKDRERAAKPRARCPQCGRLVPAESITTYHGITLCAKCRLEEEELPNHMKLKYKAKLDKDPKAAEKQKKMVMVLGVIVGVLLVIALLHAVHLF